MSRRADRSKGETSRTGPAADVRLPVIADRKVIRPSRAGRRRAVVLAAVQILLVAHIIHWVVTGRTVTPIEPSESMQMATNGVVNAGLIFFVLALLSTLVLGRWFCGWGCHIVMLQDACSWLLRRVGIKPKPFRSRLLLYVPFVLALYMFVWPVVYRWGVAPIMTRLHQQFEAIPDPGTLPPWQLSVELTTSDFWHTFPGVMVAVPFLLVCGFATVYFLGNKGFCTYGCPYGGFFAPFDQYAPGRIRVTDACEHCGHCTAVCTSNVRVHEEVREYGMVVDPGCMKCLDCVSVCPNDALYFGFGRPAVVRGKARHSEPERQYDLSMPEEIAFALVFLLAFLSFRGVYGVIPMLMAAGLAGCVTYVAWKLWTMVRRPSVNLHRFRLKYKGSLRRGGAVFAGLGSLLLVLTVHSGAVRALDFAAGRADARVTMPRAAVFAAAPLVMPAPMAAEAERALRLYRWSGWIRDGGIGLLSNSQTLMRQAWLEACTHDFAAAERLMRLRNERFGRADAVCRDIALLMRLQLHDRAAMKYYLMLVEQEPTFVMTHGDLISWYEEDNRYDDAIALVKDLVERVEDEPEIRLHLLKRLSLLYVRSGALDEGIDLIRETMAMDRPNAAANRVLAEALRRRGDTEEAVEALRRAYELAPNDEGLRAELAEQLDGLGRFGEAAEIRGK